MVDAETAALALGGGVLATESLGLTNFTGGGGGMNPQVLQAALESASSGAGQVIPVPSAGGGSGGGSAPTDQVLDLAKQVGELQGQVDASGGGDRLSDVVDRGRERGRDLIDVPSGGDPSGGERTGPNTGGTPTSGDTKTGGSQGSHSFDLQDLAGHGRLGTTAATVGEAGAAGGSAVDDAVTGTADIIGDPTALARGEKTTGLSQAAYNAGSGLRSALDPGGPIL